jgi:hypothetical protein
MSSTSFKQRILEREGYQCERCRGVEELDIYIIPPSSQPLPRPHAYLDTYVDRDTDTGTVRTTQSDINGARISKRLVTLCAKCYMRNNSLSGSSS